MCFFNIISNSNKNLGGFLYALNTAHAFQSFKYSSSLSLIGLLIDCDVRVIGMKDRGKSGAGQGNRTLYLIVGNDSLYQ